MLLIKIEKVGSHTKTQLLTVLSTLAALTSQANKQRVIDSEAGHSEFVSSINIIYHCIHFQYTDKTFY